MIRPFSLIATLALTLSPWLALAQTKPTTVPATTPSTRPVLIDMAAATADFKARAAWIHTELARVAADVAKKPPATRPMLKTRNGQLAPDPRPTPAKALVEARRLDAKVDPAVAAAIMSLEPTKDDKTKYERQLMFCRLYINEAVELVLIALKDTDETSVLPPWIGAAPAQLPAAAAQDLDSRLSAAVLGSWSAVHPEAEGGMGKVGIEAKGKESGHSYSQTESILGQFEVASPRVSFRINPAAGKEVITPTTPNFTLIVTAPLDLPGLPLKEKTLLERRYAVWWYRAPVPDISAANTAPAPTTATKPK